jgi:hypothetical protein
MKPFLCIAVLLAVLGCALAKKESRTRQEYDDVRTYVLDLERRLAEIGADADDRQRLWLEGELARARAERTAKETELTAVEKAREESVVSRVRGSARIAGSLLEGFGGPLATAFGGPLAGTAIAGLARAMAAAAAMRKETTA